MRTQPGFRIGPLEDLFGSKARSDQDMSDSDISSALLLPLVGFLGRFCDADCHVVSGAEVALTLRVVSAFMGKSSGHLTRTYRGGLAERALRSLGLRRRLGERRVCVWR